MHGILKLRSMVHSDPSMGWRERYGAERTVEVLPDEGDELLRAAAHEGPAVNAPQPEDTAGA
jgi:NADH-quinone oxidoreductase subunit B